MEKPFTHTALVRFTREYELERRYEKSMFSFELLTQCAPSMDVGIQIIMHIVQHNYLSSKSKPQKDAHLGGLTMEILLQKS